jgi:chromate transport protein ChrA
MTALFADGWVAALIIGVLVVEAAWLVARRALPAKRAAVTVLPGLAFVAALQAALWDLHWSVIALALLAAFVTHLLDLRERLRR